MSTTWTLHKEVCGDSATESGRASESRLFGGNNVHASQDAYIRA